MKLDKKQRFSIRKYAVGAASVLIGFTFSAQVVSADGLTPAQKAPETLQAVPDSPQASEAPIQDKEEKLVNKRKEKETDLTEEYPVCGWLVCISGIRLGKAWVLKEGKNYVGSHDTMSIQILGDEEIRDKNHIVLVFDTRERKALLLGEECMGFVRLNNKAEHRAKA